ncbi:elongation of very long chain fatty acids protein 7 [Drosophila sulfurigaster albostrigata]|uniref:elongation of very long chain fatty acids protein 7 n=1 Tax=Drosophila sulfurigaster albostrigata TaxID=89887 RepID=UPI002D21B275|nr:elongation of very long chain fatty acids protein 7 [Drosophila sulfurigaster albostrigata]
MPPNVVAYIYGLVRDLYDQHKDPRVSHYPLIGNLWSVMAIIGVYLAFVLHFGPKWMEHRRPFELKFVMQLYNVIQVVANTAVFIYGMCYTIFNPGYSFLCQPVEHENTTPQMMHLIYASYGYYMLKYLDLLDTVFIVLRKKNSQVSFLHVYHHAGMIFGVSIFMTFLAGSHCSMLGLVNLLVHAVMYAYYFASSHGAVKHLLWWKRHITKLQLLQFGYLTLHFLLVLLRNPCNFPVFIAFIGFTQNIFMFAMFFDFYYKTYMRKARKSEANTKSALS